LVASLETQRRKSMQSLEAVNRKLQAALDEIRTLRGILPIACTANRFGMATGSGCGWSNTCRITAMPIACVPHAWKSIIPLTRALARR